MDAKAFMIKSLLSSMGINFEEALKTVTEIQQTIQAFTNAMELIKMHQEQTNFRLARIEAKLEIPKFDPTIKEIEHVEH